MQKHLTKDILSYKKKIWCYIGLWKVLMYHGVLSIFLKYQIYI